MTKKIWSKRKTRIDKAKIIRLSKDGYNLRETAEKCGCSIAYVRKIRYPYQLEKSRKSAKKRNHERYMKDPNYRKKQIKASTDYIMNRYYNCTSFRNKVNKQRMDNYWKNKK